MTTQDPEDAAVAASGFDEPSEFHGDAVLYEEQVEPQHGVLGLTVRELSITGVWLVAFVVSFFPVFPGSGSLWATSINWLLPIGVPTAAVFLLVLRRFSPDGIRRVGSLGIDQFASVAFSVAAVWWIQQHWTLISQAIAVGMLPFSWVNWVQLVAMLALVVLTVFAPFIPGLRDDFQGRMETLAHRNAGPARPVVARPTPTVEDAQAPLIDVTASDAAALEGPDAAVADAPGHATDSTDLTEVIDTGDRFETGDGFGTGDQSSPESVPVESLLGFEPVDAVDADDAARANATDEVPRFDQPERVPLSSHVSGGDTGTTAIGEGPGDDDPQAQRLRRTGSVPVVDDDAAAPVTTQPFWALAPTERDVVDELGSPLFRIGPTAWALVLEDRGGAYVVRHDDGRIGYLHDIADITKG